MDSIKKLDQQWAQNHFALKKVVKLLTTHTETIAELEKQNSSLRTEVDELKTRPTTHAQPALAEATASDFTRADAALLKAVIYGDIASEIRKFEAMITAQAQGPAKLLPRQTRRP